MLRGLERVRVCLETVVEHVEGEMDRQVDTLSTVLVFWKTCSKHLCSKFGEFTVLEYEAFLDQKRPI